MPGNLEKSAVATGLKNVRFHPISKKGMPKKVQTTAQLHSFCTVLLISHASQLKLKVLQARLQHYMNRELSDDQAEFRQGRGIRHQIANIHCIIEKAREFQKNIYFCFIDYAKAFDCVDQNKLENSSSVGNTRPPNLPPENSICRFRSNS